MASKKKITDIVTEEVTEYLRGTDMELYNAEFVKEGRDWFLRVYIDKIEIDQYVSTEDCEKISRFLSDRLDIIDPIKQNYYLEVSSPGLDRVLLKPADFKKFAGRTVEASLYKAIDGVRSVEGTLIGLENGTIIIEDIDGKKWNIPEDAAAVVKLAVVF